MTRDPVEQVDALGAVWSPNLDAYAAGQVDSPTCVLCRTVPSCTCPPFGTPEYLALINRVHGRSS